MRAEWNPNYGDDAQPNLAPRYGLAYTRDFGSVTAKMRASYGRSTRPPGIDKKLAVPETDISGITRYGPYDRTLANPELGPEFQQGGEGGLELYMGGRASIVVTRYNQTVESLIGSVARVDSVRALEPGFVGASSSGCTSVANLRPDGYCYFRQSQNLNVGSIRNQGWELQGSVNTGPFTTKGTYSWTKSRVIGVTPKYRSQLTGTAYQAGRSPDYLPEHTWAMQVMYVQGGSAIVLNLNGIGQLYSGTDDAYLYSLFETRDLNFRWRMGIPDLVYRPIGAGYVMADMNASHRFSPATEIVLQVLNLGNYYRNDYAQFFSTIGRQMKAGLRLRL